MAGKSATFKNCNTAADDTVLIAFTSGTTGNAKGTMHFHRDVMAICDCFPRSVAKLSPDDICCGSPPFAFTFGLGGLVLFPMRVGAASLLLEQAARLSSSRASTNIARRSAGLPDGLSRHARDARPARRLVTTKCVSAGEHLPAPRSKRGRKRPTFASSTASAPPRCSTSHPGERR